MYAIRSYYETNNWADLRSDLDLNPIEGVNGKSDELDILAILVKYGVTVSYNFV